MNRAPLGAKILSIKATEYPVKGKAEAPMPAEAATILEGAAVGRATEYPVKGKAEAPMSAEAATILEGAAVEPEGVVEKLADSKLGVSP